MITTSNLKLLSISFGDIPECKIVRALICKKEDIKPEFNIDLSYITDIGPAVRFYWSAESFSETERAAIWRCIEICGNSVTKLGELYYNLRDESPEGEIIIRRACRLLLDPKIL